MRTPNSSETLDKSRVTSVPEVGQKRDKSLPEVGQKVPEVSPDWVSPCHFYSEHQMAHHLTAAGWVCDICRKDEPQ